MIMKKIFIFLALFIFLGIILNGITDCSRDESTMKVPKGFNLELPCVIYYSSSGCGWCKKFDPVWDSVKNDTNYRNINFVKGKEYSREFGISGVPAFIFISKDSVVTKKVGYRPSVIFKKNIEESL